MRVNHGVRTQNVVPPVTETVSAVSNSKEHLLGGRVIRLSLIEFDASERNEHAVLEERTSYGDVACNAKYHQKKTGFRSGRRRLGWQR